MPAAGPPCIVSSTWVLRPMVCSFRHWEIPVDKSVYSSWLWVYHEKHGLDHHPRHRRCAHQGHRRTPAAARQQAGRAEAGRPLRRLAHAGAPGAVPACRRTGWSGWSRRAAPSWRRPRSTRRSQVFAVRRMLEAEMTRAVRAQRHAGQDQGAARARGAEKAAVVGRRRLRPHRAAGRLPRAHGRAHGQRGAGADARRADLALRADHADVPERQRGRAFATTSTSTSSRRWPPRTRSARCA